MFETYGFLKSLDGMCSQSISKVFDFNSTACFFSILLTVQASMMLCHPDAKKYRNNFKAHKEELTTILYKMYNEKVFESKLNVDIIWNKTLQKTAGYFIRKSSR